MFTLKAYSFDDDGTESSQAWELPTYYLVKQKDGSFALHADFMGAANEFREYIIFSNKDDTMDTYAKGYIVNTEGQTIETIKPIDKA